MLTRSGAKLMDFGLARATGPSGTAGGSGALSVAHSGSPTMARSLTTEGSIVGTFQYMPPEQLEGKEADTRSDLWALGCLLYECVTGRKAFAGKSQASIIGAIMNIEPPPMTEAAPLSPPALERLVRSCLIKDPEERIQTAHDIRLQLEWIRDAGSQTGVPAPVAAKRRVGERVAWALAAAGLAAAALLLALRLAAPPGTKRSRLPSCRHPKPAFSPTRTPSASRPTAATWSSPPRHALAVISVGVMAMPRCGCDRSDQTRRGPFRKAISVWRCSGPPTASTSSMRPRGAN